MEKNKELKKINETLSILKNKFEEDYTSAMNQLGEQSIRENEILNKLNTFKNKEKELL